MGISILKFFVVQWLQFITFDQRIAMNFFKQQTPKDQLSSIIHQLKNRIQECLHQDWTNYLLSCNNGQLVGKTRKGKIVVYNVTDPIAECLDADAIRNIRDDWGISEEFVRSLNIPQNVSSVMGIQQAVHGNRVSPEHLEIVPSSQALDSIINSSSWSRSKEHFSWSFDGLLDYDSNFIQKYLNLCRNRQMYFWSLFIDSKINELVSNIELQEPNYVTIAQTIREIKEFKTCWVYDDLSSVMMSVEDLKIYRSNLITTLFSSIAGLLAAPVWTLVGIFAFPLYCASKTEYLGSPTFLLDSMKYFFTSLINLLTTVIFPIALYLSKEETGSYNVLKGDMLRRLNSIEELANELGNMPPPVMESVERITHVPG